MSLPASVFFSLQKVPSPSVEAAFFTGLKTGNNTFKKTNSGRFKQLDAALIRHLQSLGSASGDMLDIGISSGVTTLELDTALHAGGQSLRLTATDLSLEAYIVPTAPGCRALIDGAGHPLQYEMFGRVVRPWRRRLDYLDGMLLVRGLLNWIFVPLARKALAQNRILKKVVLISPRLRQRRDIAVQQDDVTICNEDFAGRFDVIRAANILNLDYFDETTMRRALKNVSGYLSGPGALLLIARTMGSGIHHGSLFEVDQDGRSFKIIERFGSGSEVEELVLDSRRALRP